MAVVALRYASVSCLVRASRGSPSHAASSRSRTCAQPPGPTPRAAPSGVRPPFACLLALSGVPASDTVCSATVCRLIRSRNFLRSSVDSPPSSFAAACGSAFSLSTTAAAMDGR
eukprot:4384739-Prymnesium_polylepis.1